MTKNSSYENTAKRLLNSIPSSVVYDANHIAMSSYREYEIKSKPGLNLIDLEKRIKKFILNGVEVLRQIPEYTGAVEDFKPDRKNGLERRGNNLVMSGPTLSNFLVVANCCQKIADNQKNNI